jgi:hypothetical protein
MQDEASMRNAMNLLKTMRFTEYPKHEIKIESPALGTRLKRIINSTDER